MSDVIGIDISHYQWRLNDGKVDFSQPPNWNLMKSEVDFVFIRFMNKYGEADQAYKENWSGTAGIPRGPYCNWVTGANPVEIVEKFYRLAEPLGLGELPPVLDYEPEVPANPEDIYRMLVRMNELFKHPKGVIVYSNYHFWSQITPRPTWMTGVEWIKKWVASWTTKSDPTMPPGWDTWHFWQYNTQNTLGPRYGVKSAEVDINRFNGTFEEFLKWGRYGISEPPEPPNYGDDIAEIKDRIKEISAQVIEQKMRISELDGLAVSLLERVNSLEEMIKLSQEFEGRLSNKLERLSDELEQLKNAQKGTGCLPGLIQEINHMFQRKEKE